MPDYTDMDKARIIDAASRGVPWEEIGASLSPPRSSEAVQLAARRMRRRGEWPDDPDAVREFPTGPGRPPNRVKTRTISPRFAPAVAEALRGVAEAADVRLGIVIETAIVRAAARAGGNSVSKTPLDLDPGGRELLEGGSRSETVSVCVDVESFDKLCELAKDATPSRAVHDAAVQLLQDLNFRIKP